MKKFRMDNGTIIEDLGQYCRDYVKENPDVMIVVGCDSSNQRKKTSYGTVVCFRHPYKGIHRIGWVEKVKKIRDIFTRLWKEVEYISEVAEYLETELEGHYTFKWSKVLLAEELGRASEEDVTDSQLDKWNEDATHQKKVSVHADLSNDKRFKSSRVYDAGMGYLTGLNYRVKAKPEAWAASVAADLICRR